MGRVLNDLEQARQADRQGNCQWLAVQDRRVQLSTGLPRPRCRQEGYGSSGHPRRSARPFLVNRLMLFSNGTLLRKLRPDGAWFSVAPVCAGSLAMKIVNMIVP